MPSKESKELKVFSNVTIPGDEEILCYDMFSGRYFMNTIGKVESIIRRLSYNEKGEYVRFERNQLYHELGLEPLDNGGWVEAALYIIPVRGGHGYKCKCLAIETSEM